MSMTIIHSLSNTHTHPSDESGPECLNWVLIGLDWCDILKKIPIYFDSWAFFFCMPCCHWWLVLRQNLVVYFFCFFLFIGHCTEFCMLLPNILFSLNSAHRMYVFIVYGWSLFVISIPVLSSKSNSFTVDSFCIRWWVKKEANTYYLYSLWRSFWNWL